MGGGKERAIVVTLGLQSQVVVKPKETLGFLHFCSTGTQTTDSDLWILKNKTSHCWFLSVCTVKPRQRIWKPDLPWEYHGTNSVNHPKVSVKEENNKTFIYSNLFFKGLVGNNSCKMIKVIHDVSSWLFSTNKGHCAYVIWVVLQEKCWHFWQWWQSKSNTAMASPSNGCCESPWLWATSMQSLAYRNSWLIAVSSLPLLSKCHRLNTLLPDQNPALIPESQSGEVQYSTAEKKINSNNTKKDAALFSATS